MQTVARLMSERLWIVIIPDLQLPTEPNRAGLVLRQCATYGILSVYWGLTCSGIRLPDKSRQPSASAARPCPAGLTSV
jgi:hypothetical protein